MGMEDSRQGRQDESRRHEDPNPNAAVPVDEVIYQREEATDDDGTAAQETVDDTEDDGAESGPIPMPSAEERSFMEEMSRSDWGDDDEDAGDGYDDEEYIDMPSYDELVAENAKLNRQLASVVSQYEGIKKDWDSYRKRAKEEAERNKRLASERVVAQIIPVIDDIWRSVSHMRGMGNGYATLADGNAAIAKRVIAALQKEGVEVIAPLGKPFDMNRHQAIAMEEADGYEPDTVFRVYQYGYAIGDRVIRPAIVGVAK